MMDPAQIHQGADPIPSMACADTKRLHCSAIPAGHISKVLDNGNTSSWLTDPVAPLDDENLLQEILIRLPPKPSSLPRASLVCTRWRNILSSHQFLKRFRKHHQKLPLLGFFVQNGFRGNQVFTPVMEPPDRIPTTHFAVPVFGSPDERWILNGCRHGLVVLVHNPQRNIIVWDPLTSQQHRVTFPASLEYKQMGYSRVEVLCPNARDGHVHGDCFLSPFKLVFIFIGYREALVSLYDSTSGVWGNVVSVATNHTVLMLSPSILVRNSLFWLTYRGDILMCDIERQTLGVIEKPADNHVKAYWCFHLIRMEEGGLGLAVLSELTIQLWERRSNVDSLVVGWVLLQKIIPLEEMLPRGMHSDKFFVGYDEDTNVIVLATMIGNFMLQLDSMEITRITKRENTRYDTFYPYRNFINCGNQS